jgi:hypothetical protein
MARACVPSSLPETCPPVIACFVLILFSLSGVYPGPRTRLSMLFSYQSHSLHPRRAAAYHANGLFFELFLANRFGARRSKRSMASITGEAVPQGANPSRADSTDTELTAQRAQARRPPRALPCPTFGKRPSETAECRKFIVAISAHKHPVQGNRTDRGRVFSACSGVVGTNATRIGYEQLRLATLTTSENFIKARRPSPYRPSFRELRLYGVLRSSKKVVINTAIE